MLGKTIMQKSDWPHITSHLEADECKLQWYWLYLLNPLKNQLNPSTPRNLVQV